MAESFSVVAGTIAVSQLNKLRLATKRELLLCASLVAKLRRLESRSTDTINPSKPESAAEGKVPEEVMEDAYG